MWLLPAPSLRADIWATSAQERGAVRNLVALK